MKNNSNTMSKYVHKLTEDLGYDIFDALYYVYSHPEESRLAAGDSVKLSPDEMKEGELAIEDTIDAYDVHDGLSIPALLETSDYIVTVAYNAGFDAGMDNKAESDVKPCDFFDAAEFVIKESGKSELADLIDEMVDKCPEYVPVILDRAAKILWDKAFLKGNDDGYREYTDWIETEQDRRSRYNNDL